MKILLFYGKLYVKLFDSKCCNTFVGISNKFTINYIMNIYRFKNPTFSLIVLACVVLVAVFIFLRFYDLNNYPLEVNQDELSNIYDGYCLSETGADRWGSKYPVILRAFGNSDFRTPLNAYLCAASIKLFGFSVSAGRFPSVVIGCLSLLLLYLTAKKIGGQLFAFFAVLFAGLSPWHILFSRIAHDGAILPAFFIILTFYLWLKVKETNYSYQYLIYLGLAIGVATNVYQSTKLTFFFISVFTCIEILKNNWPSIKKCFIYCFFILIGVMPQLIAIIKYPAQFFSRANGTTKPFSFTVDYFQAFLSDFFANVSPHYLFLSFGESNNLSIARLLPVEGIFFYLGLILFCIVFKKTHVFNPIFLYVFLFLAILPSALTESSPHALRASASMILIPLFSAAGVVFIWERFKKERIKSVFVGVLIIAILSNAYLFVNTYANDPYLRSDNQQHGLVKLCKDLNLHTSGYSSIYIEDLGNQPYIYVASYCGMTPEEFQLGEKEYDKSSDWDHFRKLGKYYFYSKSDIEKVPANASEKKLILLQSKEDSYTLIDSVNIDGNNFYYYSK